jgi:hypothetical protein
MIPPPANDNPLYSVQAAAVPDAMIERAVWRLYGLAGEKMEAEHDRCLWEFRAVVRQLTPETSTTAANFSAYTALNAAMTRVLALLQDVLR